MGRVTSQSEFSARFLPADDAPVDDDEDASAKRKKSTEAKMTNDDERTRILFLFI